MNPWSSVARRVCAGAVCVVIGAAPLPGRASQGDDAADAGSAELEEARVLYEQGRAKFELFDYVGAIELWTQAYALVPDGGEGFAIRNSLAYNIAAAREEAYNMTKDLKHLRQAEALLTRYLEDLEAASIQDAETKKERKETGDRIEGLRKRIAEAEAASGQATGGPAALPPSVATRNQPISAEKDRLLKDDPKYSKPHKRGRREVVAGAIMIPTGAIFTLFGLALVGDGSNVQLEGGSVMQGEAGAKATGTIMLVSALALLGGGTAAIVIGKRRKDAAFGAAMKQAEKNVAFAPMFTRDAVGATAHWRF